MQSCIRSGRTRLLDADGVALVPDGGFDRTQQPRLLHTDAVLTAAAPSTKAVASTITPTSKDISADARRVARELEQQVARAATPTTTSTRPVRQPEDGAALAVRLNGPRDPEVVELLAIMRGARERAPAASTAGTIRSHGGAGLAARLDREGGRG
ncbi:MAG: hypothetical protein WKG00_17790 [Polyangiaceae bacterium]